MRWEPACQGPCRQLWHSDVLTLCASVVLKHVYESHGDFPEAELWVMKDSVQVAGPGTGSALSHPGFLWTTQPLPCQHQDVGWEPHAHLPISDNLTSTPRIRQDVDVGYFFLVLGWLLGLSASLVAQMVKRLPTMQETRVRSLGWEDPLEKEMATHSSIHAWKIPWTEEPGGLQSIGSQRVRHDCATSSS